MFWFDFKGRKKDLCPSWAQPGRTSSLLLVGVIKSFYSIHLLKWSHGQGKCWCSQALQERAGTGGCPAGSCSPVGCLGSCIQCPPAVFLEHPPYSWLVVLSPWTVGSKSVDPFVRLTIWSHPFTVALVFRCLLGTPYPHPSITFSGVSNFPTISLYVDWDSKN